MRKDVLIAPVLQNAFHTPRQSLIYAPLHVTIVPRIVDAKTPSARRAAPF